VPTVRPEAFALKQNYPNPFNPSTVIGYYVPEDLLVRLAVCDVLGREIDVLVNERKPAGAYTAVWNSQGKPSGVYFYRLTAGSSSDVKKMAVVK
jgi:hypothetical protein